ncbi:uroporphyrinogen-III synthase [Geothrix sp. 21YS21S-4]|uniref:uroporphyrinogen-III synthase n=1 Tax=Geothrix sp. 21YS21S-4 TaxID=3068889 RepID=UPI0027B929A0|nr:uroporphyrinogen-III synthase [Geothrix sp. 21YS21S-4]
MTSAAPSPRLALARPAQHPLADTVRKAGWEPVPYAFTSLQLTSAPPPMSFAEMDAFVALSPSGAKVAAPTLPPATVCLLQGAGTADALGREDLEIHLPEEARAEALWNLLQARFPKGGDFVLARGERSREFLEAAAKGTPWRIHPWVTHREAARVPFPALPDVEGVLALSPLQAEILAPVAAGVLRFGWGEATAEAFERAGAPAHAHCDPKPGLLWAMLAQQLAFHQSPKEESPC